MITKTLTLGEELEKSFEKKPQRKKANSLAEYVSDELMVSMPRLSPELFEIEREVNVPLAEKQSEKIRRYVAHQLDSRNLASFKIRSSVIASIPKFIYVPVCEDIAIFPKSGVVFGSAKTEGFNSLLFGGNETTSFSYTDLNNIKASAQIDWEASFKLDVNVKRPQVPEGFIELGDEAVSEYYQVLRSAPKEMRKKTQLDAPRIGVLWSPEERVLYASGDIPEPRPEMPVGDPALILDIPDGEKSYRHVVAVWDIGDELPFRNWLAEFSEGRG